MKEKDYFCGNYLKNIFVLYGLGDDDICRSKILI